MQAECRASKEGPMSDQPPGDGEQLPSFDALVTAYEKRIFNVIYRIIGDYEEAADLTQETFISAYKSYARFRGEAKIFTWLYQIALNHCRNRLRQKGRMYAQRWESLDQPASPERDERTPAREIADDTQAPHVVLEEKELRQRILAAVESLPPEYREVVILREIEGLSYNEIVEVTRLSRDNVKTRLSRARAMLRRKLGPYITGT
jgi:RNA polymerase sigma-70 factor (ECF subfamily)